MTGNRKNPFMDKNYREAVWNNIAAEVDQREKVNRMPLRWIKYAAAVLIIITGALMVSVFTIKKKISEPVVASHLRVINPTARLYNVAMQDGSSVILFPNSEIVYRKSFGKSDRNINLKGKARFEVVKNTALPFRVYSNSLITTAVGTSFTIIADSLLSEVNVLLHTGKVVVEQDGRQSGKVYMAAGQSLTWNTSTGSSIVKDPVRVIKPVLPVRKEVRKPSRNFALVFTQEPLPSVLKEIGRGFDISLKYDSQELNSLYFSGTIKSTDKPVRILQRIAALHSLTITENKKGFRIRKN